MGLKFPKKKRRRVAKTALSWRRFPHSKPTKQRTIKARKRRAEQAVKVRVRADVEQRDGYCRIAKLGQQYPEVFALLGRCEGPGAWAHYGEKKRARTRGRPPEERHTTTHSLKLCNGKHHPDYDQGRLHIVPQSDAVCDGPLLFITAAGSACEPRGA